MARARLHVIGSTCRFTGVMPAPKPHSDKPGFDSLDRSSHGCSLTSAAAHVLVGAAEVTFSLSHVRASSLPLLSPRPDHVSKRSEVPWHVSADSHSCCVSSVTVCLLVSRVRSPGRMSCPEPGSFDQAVSCASGPLPWVGRANRWRRSLEITRWRCGLRAAVSLLTSICSVVWSTRVAWLNVATWP